MSETFLGQLSKFRLKQILQPIEVFIWILIICLTAVVLLLPVSDKEQNILYGLLALSAIYTIFIFHWMIPNRQEHSQAFYLFTSLGIILTVGFHYLLHPYGLQVDLFYMLIILFIGVFRNWEWMLPVFLITVGLNYLVNSLLWDHSSTLYIFNQVYDVIGLSLAALVTIFISRTIQAYEQTTSQKSKSLTMLLNSNQNLSPNTSLLESLPHYARQITEGLPTTTCRITLLTNKKDKLLDYGIYPLRYLDGLKKDLGGEYPLKNLPKHKQVVETKEPLILDQSSKPDTLTLMERKTLFWEQVQTVCIFPILLENEVLGLVSIGEERNLDREPFDQTRMDLLTTITNQIAATINTSNLHKNLEDQAKRMTVLYEVGQAISKTIEIDDLLELIYQQLTKVLPSDAYFVALYLPDHNQLDLRMLIDKGKRYPPQKTDADQGLSSWIVQNHQPLLIRDLVKEQDSLPMKPLQVGEKEITRSWLGVPLLHESEFIGLLAVASYLPGQFDQEDLALLEQLARQAALSIENARHHQEVERQACQDSLTEVLNHGTFVSRLTDQAKESLEEEIPLSIIMLDIDHFKQYNDTYGHILGDKVLRLTVQAIESHIKKGDLVGRWGGEEFAVALPRANRDQALQVAERIRTTLAELPINNHLGESIPTPTVSQGIATLFTHSSDINELLILADRALYKAKERGRDQISTAD